jgi:uncharacterized protein YjbJ (UPF0337 family)
MGEIIDRAKGKAKQVQGELTGDKALRNEGVADQIKGNVKGVAHKAGSAAKNIADTVKGAVKRDDAVPADEADTDEDRD